MLWHPKTLQNLAMYNVFFIFGRFSIAGKLPKWPKIPFQYPLALRHPKILEKCRKHHRILVSVRNRFWPPPAKADIATAILTNVIEHLVLLLPPNKHAFTAKAVWADFAYFGWKAPHILVSFLLWLSPWRHPMASSHVMKRSLLTLFMSLTLWMVGLIWPVFARDCDKSMMAVLQRHRRSWLQLERSRGRRYLIMVVALGECAKEFSVIHGAYPLLIKHSRWKSSVNIYICIILSINGVLVGTSSSHVVFSS